MAEEVNSNQSTASPRRPFLTRQAIIFAVIAGLLLAGLVVIFLGARPVSPLGLPKGELQQAQQQARNLQQVKKKLNRQYPDWEVEALKDQLDFYLNQRP